VKDLKPGSELEGAAANEFGDDPKPNEDAPKSGKEKAVTDEAPAPAATSTVSVKIDTTANMLSVYDGEKLIAAYPVTIGSEKRSPDRRLEGVCDREDAELPLGRSHAPERRAERQLPPPSARPEQPRGVVWIALNKKGIGMHGTPNPDSIGAQPVTVASVWRIGMSSGSPARWPKECRQHSLRAS
jgi:lipoprotein-anchoring transpeptidase ErfK/SrfK